VVLAAGLGTRLRPLTELRPKALVPVGNRPLLAWAVEDVAPWVGAVAVNAHHHAEQVAAVASELGAHVSVEEGQALGTAGALGRLRDWVGGRAVLVANADAWRPGGLDRLVEGWDGGRSRLLCVPDGDAADFDGTALGVAGGVRYCGAALLPWPAVSALRAEPGGLYEVLWRDADVELVLDDQANVDCGTPSDYLRANLLWSGGASVIGARAVVEGRVERSVVWDGALVEAGEHLVEVVRAPGPLTVPAPQR
jgi:N-acetyl-alpha-D-muramate 1-phosphate uridylyltransferase